MTQEDNEKHVMTLDEAIKHRIEKASIEYQMSISPVAIGGAAFASLIDKVSGKGTWDLNPWVFAYSFELVK